ncbi:MAG: single-stranded DNA-binding protein [Giesbergeria sp.]|uniref:single-stranded DNA-binding protein n=1 Tax=Giesbergeria sp. TaxID=2818473 RepID=UPI002624452F|nr:single-stranded DNA-binding protein [Giesbergeria sp.]MDD2608397.1 single-stranded DNA-binding protein [Giesbergeria sp.]
MIDALISGKVYGQPAQRSGKNGKLFALAKLRATGTDGQAQFISVIAFDDGPVAALLALKEGDSVAVTGPLKVATWQDKEGNHRPSLDIVAQQVMTVYQVRHKRSATQAESAPEQHHLPPREDRWPPQNLPERYEPPDGSIPF